MRHYGIALFGALLLFVGCTAPNTNQTSPNITLNTKEVVVPEISILKPSSGFTTEENSVVAERKNYRKMGRAA